MRNGTYVGANNLKPNARILLLHPVAPRDGNEGPFHLETQGFLLNTTHVDEVFCMGAPLSFEVQGETKKVVPFVIEKTKWAESQGYDVVVINCMLDPGLREAKTSVSIPVLGLKEATTAIASMFGKNPGYIFPHNIAVLDLATDEEKTFDALLEIGRNKIVNQGVDVLVPGCAYLGGMADRLQADLGVPVLANRDIGLKLAELVATFNLKPEKSWVKDTRSIRKMRLSKLYQLPVFGKIFYRSAMLVKKLSL